MGHFDSKISKFEKRKIDICAKMDMYDIESKELSRQRKDIIESKSTIPEDMPSDINAQIDAIYENKRNEIEEKASNLADEIREAHIEADEAVEEMYTESNKLKNSAERVSGLKHVPLVGSFLDNKGEELRGKSERIFNIAAETRKYSDSLASSRNRLLERPK